MKCRECRDGKPDNCTGWVITDDDEVGVCETAEDAVKCGKPRRYFPQQTCYLSRGHSGDHADDTHMWEDW